MKREIPRKEQSQVAIRSKLNSGVISATRVIITTLLATFALFSCEQEDPMNLGEDLSPVKNKFIVLENDYLFFPDFESFESAIKENKNLSEKHLAQQQQNVGFESMLSSFFIAVEHEKEYYSELKEKLLSSSEGPTISKLGHSVYVVQNLDEYRIDDTGFIQMNIFRTEAASVVNRQGLVRIGQTLYQYSWDNLKSIFLSDPSSASDKEIELLIQADISDEEVGVFVSPVTHQSMLHPNGITNFFGNCDGQDSDTRIYGELDLATTTRQHLVKVKCTVSSQGTTCENIYETRFVSTLEVYATREFAFLFIFVPAAGNIQITGNYTITANGGPLANISNTFNFNESQDSNSWLRRTIVSTDEPYGFDFTNTIASFRSDGQIFCQVGF